jgi:hypothetical protein
MCEGKNGVYTENLTLPKMLIEEFGDEYRKYMKTTKKLFPFIY